jgi:hypothetical protein
MKIGMLAFCLLISGGAVHAQTHKSTSPAAAQKPAD